MGTKNRAVFVRDATGFVRNISTLDSFNINMGQLGPQTSMVFVLAASFALFSRTNLLYSVLLDIPLLLPVAVM